MRSTIPVTHSQLSWRTALRCNGGECVQVAPKGDTIIIGDSKSPDGPFLAYSHAEWKTFVEGIRRGDFDDLL
jgi:predicted secreted Zn-dependent protease